MPSRVACLHVLFSIFYTNTVFSSPCSILPGSSWSISLCPLLFRSRYLTPVFVLPHCLIALRPLLPFVCFPELRFPLSALASPLKGSNTLPALRSETPLKWSEAPTSSPERGIQYVDLNLCLVLSMAEVRDMTAYIPFKTAISDSTDR